MTLKWLHENSEYLYTVGMVFIGLLIVWTVVISMANSVPKAEDLEFMQLAGLNLPQLNSSITVPLEVTNTENFSMQIFSVCYTDPQELQAYVTFETDLANFTRIDAYQTLIANVTVHEEPNSFDGEIYIRFYGLIP